MFGVTVTEPRRQFQIAFLMFDRDGNGIVDKEEFQAVSLSMSCLVNGFSLTYFVSSDSTSRE